MNLQDIIRYADDQTTASERAGETAAVRLWRQLGETAQQLTAMNFRIADQAAAKAARVESWKR